MRYSDAIVGGVCGNCGLTLMPNPAQQHDEEIRTADPKSDSYGF